MLYDELGELPIIAENAKAEQLLTDTAFPGMKILEFGDTEGKSIDVPHNCNKKALLTTANDNEVVNGWYVTDEQKAFVDAYTHRHEGGQSHKQCFDLVCNGLYCNRATNDGSWHLSRHS